MGTWLSELYRYRDLLWMWTLRDIKVRYKQSLLGAAWAIVQPLSLMLIFSVIFSYFVKVPTEGIPYPVFSYSAVLPWTFFAASISFAVPSLVQNMSLVTKIYFPREILPMSAVGASMVDFLIACGVFAIMLVLYDIPFRVTLVLAPVLLLIQVFFTLGIVLFSSALNVFYRDIRFVVPLLVQLWMYVSPVIYPVTTVPESLRGLYMLNPMAGLIEAYRAIALRGSWPQWEYLAISAAVAVVVFILGYAYFKRVEWQFADLI
ncbi:MAG: ABC transporter permease [Chloroflexi bacterium]|nr:ABC transporter permease [Chloroflexota bacterium]